MAVKAKAAEVDGAESLWLALGRTRKLAALYARGPGRKGALTWAALSLVMAFANTGASMVWGNARGEATTRGRGIHRKF